MSTNDLPPLPKSLSGINKMLASDSGLVSDVETEIQNIKNNDLKQYENQKENNNTNLDLSNKINNNNNNNNNTNNNISNNNALKDASDKFNNSTSDITTITTTAIASTSAVTPLKEINGNETISEIPPAIPGSKLDTQIATLRKEMFGLRQLDLSLLSQLWALNDSIQEFRTMIQEQDQEDDDNYSAHSRSPSPYDSVSSDAEDEILNLKLKAHMELKSGNVITTQPKLTKAALYADNEMTNQTTTISASISSTSSTSPSSATSSSTVSAASAAAEQQQQKSQLIKPPLPKPLDVKPVPRMRSAPPPPPTHRKSQSAPPRPT